MRQHGLLDGEVISSSPRGSRPASDETTSTFPAKVYCRTNFLCSCTLDLLCFSLFVSLTSLVSAFTSLILSATITNFDDDLNSEKKASICLTPSCVHASSELLYNLSPDYQNVDACTDFEELVCGGWRERNDLRPDQGDAFTGTFMAEASQTLLRHILEAPYPKDSAVSNDVLCISMCLREQADWMSSTPISRPCSSNPLSSLQTRRISSR